MWQRLLEWLLDHALGLRRCTVCKEQGHKDDMISVGLGMWVCCEECREIDQEGNAW